jgi:hypothetical protein
MDVGSPQHIVVGVAGSTNLYVYDIRNFHLPVQVLTTHLHTQFRALACFTNKTGGPEGVVSGSIEGIGHLLVFYHAHYLSRSCFIDSGRCSINYYNKTSEFAVSSKGDRGFNINRMQGSNKNEAYAVNDIIFHPKSWGTFATGGSDGAVHIWHKEAWKRLKQFNMCPAPVTSLAFDESGDRLLYACSYDWSKGCHFAGQYPIQVFLHNCLRSDVVHSNFPI